MTLLTACVHSCGIEEKDEEIQDVSNDYYVIESQIKCKPIETKAHGDSLVVS